MPSLAIAVLLANVLPSELPPDKFNLPVQHRTRTCVEMKGKFLLLRFADGTPTGFFAHADDPSQQGSAEPCGPPARWKSTRTRRSNRPTI